MRRKKFVFKLIGIILLIEIVAGIAAWHVGYDRKQAMLAEAASQPEPTKVTPAMSPLLVPPEEIEAYHNEYERLYGGARYAFSTIYSMPSNFRGKYINTDERGFRITPPSPNPPDGSPRKQVAFFGPSLIFGTRPAENDEQTIPSWFQQVSNGRWAAKNYGVPGHHSVQFTLTMLSELNRHSGARPFELAFVYGTVNDCSVARDRVLGLNTRAPFGSDGLILTLNDKILKIELAKQGIHLFDWKQVSNYLKTTVGEFILRQLHRERVHRLIRLLVDPDYYPWRCCKWPNSTPQERPLRLSLSEEEAVIEREIRHVINVYKTKADLIRTLARKFSFDVYFVHNPSVHTKANPNAGEEKTRDTGIHGKIFVRCAQRFREAIQEFDDGIDLTNLPLPASKVYSDQVHLNGLGNKAVAQALYDVVKDRDSAVNPNTRVSKSGPRLE